MERLIDVSGRVHVGIFREPVELVNHRDFPLTNPFGRKVKGIRRHFATIETAMGEVAAIGESNIDHIQRLGSALDSIREA